MAHASEDALKPLHLVLRQLRDIRGLREMKPGIFYLKAAAFVHFHDEAGVLHADLKKPGGSGWDHYPLDTPPQHRKLVDDAKRRVAKFLDDE